MKLLVGKSGVNVLTATDPNDFIFNSDLNTFKIVSQGTLTSQTVSGNPTTFSVSHGVTSTTPVVYAVLKFPDGRIYLPGSIEPRTSNSIFRYWNVEVDSSNIYFNVYKVAGANFNVDIEYFVFEAPITGNGPTVGSLMGLRVAKGTNNVLTETYLDNLVYDSGYDTLKYHISGTKSLTITAGQSDVSTTVNHSLSYPPFFMSYLELTFALGSGKWSQVPFNSSAVSDYATITSSVNSTNISFRATTTFPGGFGAQTLNFAYKIFRNELNI